MYKYEMHCHTKEGSKCSVLSAVDAVRFYKGMGYDGIFISDHFTGNTTVPKDATWTERIELFYHNGFEIAEEEGKKVGLKVFFAPEFSIKGNDFLILGLGKDWWLKQTDFFDLTENQQLDRIREGGGFVVHAHPFAQERWIASIRLFPERTDAVEVVNGGGSVEFNRRAIWYAKEFGFPMTGGSDTHSTDVQNLCGIEVDHECKDVFDVIKAIKDGSAKPFSVKHGYLLENKE